MAEKTSTGSKTGIPTETSVMGLVSYACVQGAVSFTIYTSKKGRIWVTMRTWGDQAYSTACELLTSSDGRDLSLAMLVVSVAHLAKAQGKAGRVDTWFRAPVDTGVVQQALDWVPYAMHQLSSGGSLADLAMPPYAEGDVTPNN